jgi:hypothetical protein
MSDNKETIVRLVDGVFSPEDAKEVAVTLLKSKIQFHVFKNMHTEETTGKEDPFSKQRIRELKSSADTLNYLCDYSSKTNKKIRIYSQMVIEVID